MHELRQHQRLQLKFARVVTGVSPVQPIPIRDSRPRLSSGAELSQELREGHGFSRAASLPDLDRL